MTNKMIEEMAKEIFNTCAWRFGKPNDYKEIFKDIAEDLIKLKYCKIPEGSVVVDKEYLKKELQGLEAQVRKETAREIIHYIDTEIRNYTNDSDFISFNEDIKYLKKQFGVEVEE